LCERFRHVDGTWAEWEPVFSVCPAERRNQLESFEREAEGEQVSQRRVFPVAIAAPGIDLL
jgi:hypothetical protein